MEKPAEIPDKVKKKTSKKDLIISATALIATVALCVVLVLYWDYIDRVRQYGYVGVFVISIFAGGTIVVPVPGLLVVFTLGSVLNPLIVGAVAGLGEAIGSLGIYLTGYGGHGTLHRINSRLANKFTEWIQRRGSVIVFLMSAIINPFYYPFTAVAGMLRFGLVKFFFLSFAGKTIKNIAVAYIGFLGLGSILRFFGIGV